MAISVVTDLRNTATTTALSWTTPTLAIGDIIVVTAYSEDSVNFPMGAPTATGITFLQRVRDVTASHCFVSIYTGVATAPGATTITSANTGVSSNLHSGVAYVFPLADGYSLAGSPNTVDTRGTGAPTATLAGTSGNICVGINGDWAAINPSTRAYRGTVTQDGTSFLASTATGYFWHQTLAASSTAIGLTAPTGQTYTDAGVEIQLGGGAFTGSATTIATLTGVAAGNVDHATGATPTLSLAGVAAGVIGTSSGATATLNLAEVAAGGGSGGATTGTVLAATADGVVGTSSGAAATLSLTGVAAGQGSQPSSGATSTLSLAATAAGVVGTSSGAAVTLVLAGVAAGVASAPGGNATATLNLAGIAAGQVGTTTGATTGVALAGVAAGIVGKSSGATLTLTLTGLTGGANTRTGSADTTLTLTGAADGVVGGGGGNADAILELIAEADGVVSGTVDTTFTPDRPDWTREDTGSIIYEQRAILGPGETVRFGLSGVESYTLLAETFDPTQPILLALSYYPDAHSVIPLMAVAVTAENDPANGAFLVVESPSYGGRVLVTNENLTSSVLVNIYSSNRSVQAPRYPMDATPGRVFANTTGFDAATAQFLQSVDVIGLGYCANVNAGITATSTGSGTLWFYYRDFTGTQRQIPVMTVAAGINPPVIVPLPFCIGQFYFTPTGTDAAGAITVQAFPARS